MKKKICWILLIVLLVQMLPLHRVFATPQEHPGDTRIKQVGGKPSIGYDNSPSNRGFYADIQWDLPTFGGVYQYFNVYYKKDGENYKPYGSSLASDVTEVRLSKLDSGTIYHAYVNAVHAHSDSDPDYPSQIHSSVAEEDDTVMFLTGIDVSVYPKGTEEIEIVWDDVMLNNQRIGYRIYIAQSRDFATTSPIEVYPENIGPSGAVKPVAGNKLSYIAKNRKPGTVYYVKVEPVIHDTRIDVSPFQKVAVGYTYIPATMTRVSAGTDYDIWKMEWERVTSSVSGTEETEYIIMQQETGDLWKSIGGQKDVIRYVKVYHGEEDRYKYKVRVYIQDEVDDYGNPLYIESNELSAYVSEVPYHPAVPDIRHSIPENPEEHMEIGEDSIKIIWYAPIGADGEIDTSIYYDLWITTDPTELNDDVTPPTISDLQPDEENYVYEKIGDSLTDYIVAYQYTFEDLEPNTTYYIKMVAKKRFMVNIEGTITEVFYNSDPAIEIVLTDSGEIYVPTAPAKPPFELKKDDEGNLYVDQTSVTVQWKTGWFEIKDPVTGEWILYISSIHGDISAYESREIQYDSGVKFAIGYMELPDDLDDYSILRSEPLQITEIPNLYGDTHSTMEYTITNLDPNRIYIIWLRAYRDFDNMSEPSDPVIVTTDPDYNIPLEKPAVPKWTRAAARDNNEGVELAWDRSTERHGLYYTYYLKYGNQDNIQAANQEIEIPSTYFDVADYYLVEGLEPLTTYYFWVMVEVSNDEGEMESSEWSDSKVVTTTQYVAPDTPTGFGIKNSADAIGKNHITYEWNHDSDGVDYILEFADNPDYEDAQKFEISGEWEYKVENLTSNKRYYARLYAVDKETGLVSFPTHTVAVKTLRSDDDYDTDDDNETVIEGPFIEDGYDKDSDEWTKEIIGIDADRFLEIIVTDRYLDYKIDMSDPPSSYKPLKRRRVRVAYKVFDGLSQAKENLIIDIGKGGVFTIRPYVLKVSELSRFFSNSEDVVVDLVFDDSMSTSVFYQLNVNPVNMVQLDIELRSGSTVIPIDKLNKPMQVTMSYDDLYWYYGGNVQAAILKQSNFGAQWTYLASESMSKWDSSDAFIHFETLHTGKMGIVMKNDEWRFLDISSHWAASDIRLIFSKYNIKSVSESQTMFYPENAITVNDCTKFILDALGVEYNESNYMQIAVKAGLMRHVKNREYISRQEAIAMLMRLYEIKTGEKIEVVNTPVIVQYRDMSTVGSDFKEIIEFAAQKGIIIGKSDTILAPAENVTRAEVIAMLRRTLQAVGEL